MSQAPFPTSGAYIKSVKESSRRVRESANIKISTQAIDDLLLSVPESTFNRLKSQHGVSFPLNFPTLLSEINFLSLLALLNTLSGYRDPFHKATGQGAYQNVVKLMLGMFISDEGGEGGVGNALSAKGLRDLKEETVASIWGVSLFSERAHESLPGVTIGQKEGPVNEPIELVVKLCNDTGKRLLEGGYASLGELVVEILRESKGVWEKDGEAVAADHFIERLVKAIPGFADMTSLPPSTFPSASGSSSSSDMPIPLYIFKKAFFLLFALHNRLPASEKVPSPAGSDLPMFVDNVIPTMLVHLEIVDLSETNVPALKKWGEDAHNFREALKADETGSSLPKVKEGPNLTASETYIVRAASIDAGEAVVRRAKELSGREGMSWLGGITEVDVDGYLWSVAKDDAVLRKVPRLVERGTIMY